MLRKRKEAKRKSIAETLLRDMQGSAAEKLVLFEKLKARGGFDGENRRELLKIEKDVANVRGDGERERVYIGMSGCAVRWLTSQFLLFFDMAGLG